MPVTQKIKAGIIGGAGYTGGELIRILLHHPAVEISFVQSKSNAGNSLSKVHQDLAGDTAMLYSVQHHFDIDVLFFCGGHGEAIRFFQEYDIPARLKLIDLGNDFRLAKDAVAGNRKFIYGLPEINRQQIASSASIANPGCFATAIQLGLLPLAKAGLLKDLFITGITGATGAGQSLSETSHFSWRSNNIQAYKTFTHQHLGEIGQSLAALQPSSAFDLSFVPWRGDFARGIFATAQMKYDGRIETLTEMYDSFYADEPFVVVCHEPIHLKQVVNTNKAVIQLEQLGNKLAIHSAIDNLAKGASGQAIQNMNIMFGLDETSGLQLKANYF